MKHTTCLKRLTGLTICLALFFTAAPSSADETTVDPAYPGYSASTDSLMVSGLEIVQTGLLAYYRLHGQWPANWKQVEDDWLAGGKILSPQLHEIAPDDQVLDIDGDIVYMGPQPDGTALIAILQGDGSIRPYLLNVQAPNPY